MPNAIVIYFSRRGENYWAGSVRSLERGNTEVAAGYISGAIGCEAFEIVPAKEYPADYYACCDEAKAELQSHARVDAGEYPDFSGYEAVFLGYPNWWGTVPMVVDTFLCHYGDWAGKRIFPFCTNEGSGLGGSVRSIEEACPGAVVDGGLSIIGNKVGESRNEIEGWASGCLRNAFGR